MFYNELLKKTNSEKEYLLSAPIIEDVMLGRFDLSTYIAFLSQAYHHVKHTVPLLMAAGSRLSTDQRYLQPAILEYIDEEAGHELWILNDVEACGVDRSQAVARPAPFESEVMVSYLYDTVNRKNPLGIFGMVLVLEGTSAGLATEVGKIVQKKLGLPAEAMSYLESHGALDQQHLKGFEELMDRIEDKDTQDAIIHAARSVYRLYGDVYRAIPAQAEIWRKVVVSSTSVA
jgi:long-chain acyl-CoA synthetase